MNKEETQNDGEQSLSDNEILDISSQSKTVENEESRIDAQVEEVLGEHLTASTDQVEDKTQNTTVGEISEDKDKSKEEESLNGNSDDSEEDGVNNQDDINPKPQKLDRRIAKLYAKNRLLSGDDSDIDIEAVAIEIQKYPFHQKKEALNNLLAQNKSLTSGSKNDGTVEYSEEDTESIIEAEVENRLSAMNDEIQEKERLQDLIKTLEAHPELDKDSKEFNKPMHDAVEALYTKGMKVSEAYQLLKNSIAVAKGKIIEQEKNSSEIKKQQALSGSIGVSSGDVKDDGVMTWEKLGELERSDPEQFMKIVSSGNLPTR
jgi:hypothetical protein